MNFSELFLSDKKTKEVLNSIKNGKNVRILGLTNSRLSYFVGNIFNKIDKMVLFITYDTARIAQMHEDLLRLIPAEEILLYPEIEVLPHEQIRPDFRVIKDRLKVLQELLLNQEQKIVLTTGMAILRKLMPATIFKKYSLSVQREQQLNFEQLKKRLTFLGYERVKMIESPQQFSIRGGIVDIFTITSNRPYRIELFGDEVDSIRKFDTGSQRSVEKLSQIIIPPAREIMLHPQNVKQKIPMIKQDYDRAIKRLKNTGYNEEAKYLTEKSQENLEKLRELNRFPGYEQFLPYFHNNLNTIFDYLNDNSVIFFDQPDKVQQRVKDYAREIQENQITLLEQGNIIPSYNENFFDVDNFITTCHQRHGVYFSDEYKRNPLGSSYKDIKFKTRGVEPYHGQLELFVERLKELVSNNYRIVLTFNTENKAKRISDYLKEEDLPVVYTDNEVSRKKL